MKIDVRAALLVASLCLAACGQEPPAKPAPVVEDEPNLSYQPMSPTKTYPLTTCTVHGTELASLGHPPFAIAYKAYEMQFCSKKCLWEFAKDPEMYTRKAYP